MTKCAQGIDCYEITFYKILASSVELPKLKLLCASKLSSQISAYWEVSLAKLAEVVLLSAKIRDRCAIRSYRGEWRTANSMQTKLVAMQFPNGGSWEFQRLTTLPEENSGGARDGGASKHQIVVLPNLGKSKKDLCLLVPKPIDLTHFCKLW